jgi:protein SCO1
MKPLNLLILSLLAATWVSCRETPNGLTPDPDAPAAESAASARTFQVIGVIRSVDPANLTVLIQHEEIPGFMAAMTMPFNVKDRAELEGLQPGDTVTFRLNYTPGEAWIDRIQKIDSPAAQNTERPAVRIVRTVEPLSIWDLMPDYRFTNQFGNALQLRDYTGRAYAMTFIFTRCPIPDFCPRMSRQFAQAKEKLKTTPGTPSNWHLFSISFDPHFDTPDVLLQYAKAFEYDPKYWSFITGAMIDIDAITEQFSLPITKQGEDWDHKLRTVVVDAGGRIQHVFVGFDWTGDELAEELIQAARSENAENAGQ